MLPCPPLVVEPSLVHGTGVDDLLWLPRAIMPAVLQDISNCTPLGAAVEAIQDSVQTAFPQAAPLLVLAGYTLVFAFLARRFFRWE